MCFRQGKRGLIAQHALHSNTALKTPIYWRDSEMYVGNLAPNSKMPNSVDALWERWCKSGDGSDLNRAVYPKDTPLTKFKSCSQLVHCDSEHVEWLLWLYGFGYVEEPADGNCFFHGVARACQSTHEEIRRRHVHTLIDMALEPQGVANEISERPRDAEVLLQTLRGTLPEEYFANFQRCSEKRQNYIMVAAKSMTWINDEAEILALAKDLDLAIYIWGYHPIARELQVKSEFNIEGGSTTVHLFHHCGPYVEERRRGDVWVWKQGIWQKGCVHSQGKDGSLTVSLNAKPGRTFKAKQHELHHRTGEFIAQRGVHYSTLIPTLCAAAMRARLVTLGWALARKQDAADAYTEYAGRAKQGQSAEALYRLHRGLINCAEAKRLLKKYGVCTTGTKRQLLRRVRCVLACDMGRSGHTF